MPLPWLVNLWACNPYVTESRRDAFVDSEQFAPPSDPGLATVLSRADPLADPRDHSKADWANSLRTDWPEVPPVIPPEHKVFKSHDDAVLTFLKRYYGITKSQPDIQCFDRANYQLHIAGYAPSGPEVLVDSPTILLLREYRDEPGDPLRTEVQVAATLKATDYLSASLQAGVPVLIGLRLNFTGPLLRDWRPNERSSTDYVEPTNHYVVAVGLGRDEIGEYVSFYDYGHRFAEVDRLYLNDRLLFESANGKRTLTEVRISRPHHRPVDLDAELR